MRFFLAYPGKAIKLTMNLVTLPCSLFNIIVDYSFLFDSICSDYELEFNTM